MMGALRCTRTRRAIRGCSSSGRLGWRRVLDEGVTQAEVDDYVSSLVGSFKVGLATNAGIADRLSEAEMYGYGPGYLDEFPERVRSVTLEEVNEALRRHVRLDKLTIVVAGPAPE